MTDNFIKKLYMKPRSQKIIVTDEARVLKALRLEHGLSMEQAAPLAGVSASTIAHIETGRMNAPKGEKLERFLKVYGDIQAKSFYGRVKNFKDKPSAKVELLELVKRANEGQVQTLLQIVRGILG